MSFYSLGGVAVQTCSVGYLVSQIVKHVDSVRFEIEILKRIDKKCPFNNDNGK